MNLSSLKFPTVITVKVIANAPKNEIVGQMENGVWKIRISAPREKGKANKELTQFLEETFGRKIEILSGLHEPLKRVKIH